MTKFHDIIIISAELYLDICSAAVAVMDLIRRRIRIN